MSTMIALWGVSNRGKTTTIRLVFEELRSSATLITSGRRARKEVLGAILEIDGVLVGFTSQGDQGEILLESIPPLIEAGCAVIVCATHTRGGTTDALVHLAAESHYEIDWVEKGRQEHADHDSGNRQKAAEIIAKVRSAVSSAQLVSA